MRLNDRKGLLEILQTNTCLWGGKFNPIIPVFRQVPNWWDRHGHRFETAKQIINGYLDRYEPDFLVEAEKGLASGLGFSAARVLQLREVLAREGDYDRDGNGLSVFDVYKELYTKEFQFARRHNHNITIIRAEDRRFEAFCACVFGGFPKQKNLNYFRRGFKDAFDPSEVVLNGAALAKLYRSGLTSPLRLGHARIEVEYNDHSPTTLFVLNAFESRDLIDFWNLRTLQRDIIAVPLQWVKELSDYSRSVVKKAYRPMPGNPHRVMLRAHVMFSRSISQPDIDELYKKYFKVRLSDANVRQDWYPTIWRPASSMQIRSTRPTLKAAEKTFDVQYSEDKPDIRFDSLHPEFAARFAGENRWANVIKLRDWSFKNQIATVLPTEYRDPKFSPFRVVGDTFIPTTEGFVMFPRYRDIQHYLKLADGVGAIAEWLDASKVQIKLSDAGRATQQIIQTLEGFGGVRSLANAGVLKLLNEMSRRPVTKSMRQQEFINKVNDAVKGDIWLKGAAESLIKRNAVELGLELKCSKCSSWSWYSLKELDYVVHCSLCLREFGFPIVDPGGSDSSRWAYRLIGPFALPGYANGGYAASLAIRFFSEIVGHDDSRVAWSAGQELTFPSGKKVEADFILWYQRTQMFGLDYPTEIVFGEAKSFGRKGSRNGLNAGNTHSKDDVFNEEDIDRMRVLAEAFPGAVLVFATMKEASELAKSEVARLRNLAEWGREYVKQTRSARAPVIVLTGTELFTGYSLQSTWTDKGGKHKELALPGYLRLDHLKTLADLTQQLYLDMPPYYEWIEAKWKARRLRREKRIQAR